MIKSISKHSLFVIDDDDAIRDALIFSFDAQFDLQTFPDGTTGLAALRQQAPDVVLLDVMLPDQSGIDILGEIKAIAPSTQVIMITAVQEAAPAVAAMKRGAFDYVTKPLQLEALEIAIGNALATVRLRREVEQLQAQYLAENIPCFIGESNAIKSVMELIERVARSATTPVMILGETGTGKELIARSIHYRSANFRGPLVCVNCAAIPDHLIESELFGYVKGAFSGAQSTGKNGLIEEAHNGTLFLDEVGDLGADAQAKLLRFLENGEFYPVGGTKLRHVQTRVVSATNRNLETFIEQGRFRADLYYRLGVVRLSVPSLNERPDDILPLAKKFLFEFSKSFNRPLQGISPEVERALREHRWKGNVRELRNVIERAVLLGERDCIAVADLDLPGSPAARPATTPFPPLPPEGIDLTALETTFERFYIDQALAMAKGNESRAARLLNLNHHTFRYRRKKTQRQPAEE